MLLASSLLPFILGLLGWPYVVFVLAAGGILLGQNLRLARRSADRRVALASFHASNLFLVLLFLGVVLDVGLRQ
jgi:heme O synthase-like polyprenyltransferase